MNEAQKAAVLHGEGPAFVAAGPGSGKTTVIVRRLLYLIQERQVPPQQILVITFTKEAALTMQKRFYEEAQAFGMSRMQSKGFVSFGTFHSFFYHIIKSIKKYSEYQLITQQEQYRIGKAVLQKFSQEEVTETDMNHFLTKLSFYKNTGELSTEYSVTKSPKKETITNTDEENVRFLQFMEQYETAKTQYKKMDFDDMLYLCKKEMESDSGLRKTWQKRFSYILIDEYQDINPIQREIIQLLVVAPYNLFVVGDDDQAIYGFRGSEADVFQKFIKDYPNAAQRKLVENYRCGETIVKASRSLIEHNDNRVAKELVSTDKNSAKGQIRALGAISTKACYEKLALCLKEKPIEELQEEAVLFRTNSAMQMFATVLSGQHIPFVLREKMRCIYDHFLMRDLEDYFLAASGCRERVVFLRLFQRLHVPLGREGLREQQVDLAQVKAFYGSGFYENRQAVLAIESLERHLERLAGMRPGLGIHYILHAMDYQGYLLRKAANSKELTQEWNQMLEWFREDASGFPDFTSWKLHQELYAKELAKEQETSPKEKVGIRLLTMHAAKGLEFRKVYIMNLNEGTIPQIRRGEVITQRRLEEERRLFYVGLTRAKEAVELHYLTGTKENPRLPSRFLEELGNANVLVGSGTPCYNFPKENMEG